MQGAIGPERSPQQRDRLFEHALATRLRPLWETDAKQARIVASSISRLLKGIEDPSVRRIIRSDLAFRILPGVDTSPKPRAVPYVKALIDYRNALEARGVAFDGTPIFSAA